MLYNAQIKLLETQEMNDTDQGGGVATGRVIVGGVMDNVFPSISDINYVVGVTHFRKVVLAVRDAAREMLYGANVIIGDTPDDPLVTTCLFPATKSYERRPDALDRVQSYLAAGAKWDGYLYDTHIAGMKSITLLQAIGSALPAIGKTLLLRMYEGNPNQYEQYVRVADVTASPRTFTVVEPGQTASITFTKNVVLVKLENALAYDFYGPAATSLDGGAPFANKAVVRDTMVADAASYYGTTKLKTVNTVGATHCVVDDIYTQLVPSSQTEVIMADVTPALTKQALVTAGGVITLNTSSPLSPSSSLFIGGGISPGSLSIVMASATYTDKNGDLMNGTTVVGSVDYLNGMVSSSLSLDGSKDISYIQAQGIPTTTNSMALPVTVENRSLSYVISIAPIPGKGTLSVQYLSQGSWYLLQDPGSGALKGSDSSHGGGAINFTTGSVSITCGALPDIGSKIILQWGQAISFDATGATTSDKRMSMMLFADWAIAPETLSVSWVQNGQTYTVTDNGKGVLSGTNGTTGSVVYRTGSITITPPMLPAKETVVTIAVTESASVVETFVSATESGTTIVGNLGHYPVSKSSVVMSIGVQRPDQVGGDFTPVSRMRPIKVVDDGEGFLRALYDDGSVSPNFGTIDYATGAYSLTRSQASINAYGQYDYEEVGYTTGMGSSGLEVRSYEVTSIRGTRNVSGVLQGKSLSDIGLVDGTISYSYGSSAAFSVTRTINELFFPRNKDGSSLYTSDTVAGTWKIGGRMYYTTAKGGPGVLFVNSGDFSGGSPAGNSNGSLTTWTPDAYNTLIEYGVVRSTQVSAVHTMVFRTPVFPIRPGSFQISMRNASGDIVSTSADMNGRINSSFVVGKIDMQLGIGEVRIIGAGPQVPVASVDPTFYAANPSATVGAGFMDATTFTFNAVGYSYLPLDKNIIGIDPVRLPSDGRVVIFRPANVVVMHNTQKITQAVSNGATVDCGRTRLASIVVKGADGEEALTGFSTDLDAGTVQFTNVAGIAQPVSISHRIEDMLLLKTADIDGTLTFHQAITHEFPVGSFVSSALIAGDMQARVSGMFDQSVWDSHWYDSPTMALADATYDSINYPPIIFNTGAVTGRWALKFTGTTTFDIISEHLGIIGSGNTSTNVRPINPYTVTPYFELDFRGFGSRWTFGNVLRFDTVGAEFPFWIIRTTKQGTPTSVGDSLTIFARGNNRL